jgi:signal peptidase
MEKQTEEIKKKTPKKRNKVLNIITWVIMGVLGLAILGMLFVYISPSYDMFYVKTGSMRPDINPGDLVITGKVGGLFTGSLAVGKVIAFKDSNATVTHRIYAIEGGMLRTKGDANEDPDEHLLPVSSVLGIYMFKIPYLGYINGFVSKKTGWFFVIIIPTLLLVGFLVKDIIKESMKGSKKKGKNEINGGDAYQGENKDGKQTTDKKLETKL